MALKYGSWNKKLKIKNKVMQSMAVKDIILVIKSIGKKIPAQTQKNARLYPKIKPAVVATALPPLKPRKIEKVCPKIASIPKIIPKGCGPR